MISSGVAVTILGIVTLLIAVAATFGSFRVSRNTAAVTQYRDTALAWEGRARAQQQEITDLKRESEHEIAALKAANVEKDKLISRLQTQVSFLQDTVTGKAQLDVLSQRQQEAMAVIETIRADVSAMHAAFLAARPGTA